MVASRFTTSIDMEIEFQRNAWCIPTIFIDSSMEAISLTIENPVGTLPDLFLVNVADLNL